MVITKSGCTSRALDEPIDRSIFRECRRWNWRTARQRERRDGELLFSAQMERLTAGDQGFELRACFQQCGDLRRCRLNLLEVIEQQQDLFVAQFIL